MGVGMIRKFTGTSVFVSCFENALEVLPFVFRHSGISETAGLRVFRQQSMEDRRTASMQSADKEE